MMRWKSSYAFETLFEILVNKQRDKLGRSFVEIDK